MKPTPKPTVPDKVKKLIRDLPKLPEKKRFLVMEQSVESPAQIVKHLEAQQKEEL